jgi:hypothetical protein
MSKARIFKPAEVAFLPSVRCYYSIDSLHRKVSYLFEPDGQNFCRKYLKVKEVIQLLSIALQSA